MFKRSKVFRILALGLLAVLVLTAAAGCGGSSDKTGDSGEGPLKVTFIQDFPQPPWVAQMPWTVAAEKGWYAEKNMDVDWVWPSTPSDPIKLVATGKADITVTYTPDILVNAAEGLNVLAVASIMDKDCGGIAAFDYVKTPKDLKGKTVAIYDIPLTRLHSSSLFKHYGLSEDDVKVVSAGDFSVPLMIAKKVDAADAAAPMEKVMVEQQMKNKLNFFYYDESNGVPNRYWFVMVVNPKFAEEHPQAVKDFVEVTFKGLNYAADNPKEAEDIFAAKNTDLEKPVVEAGWEAMKPSLERFNPDKPEGWMDPEIWQGYHDYLYENELLRNKVDISKILTDEFLPGK